MEVGWSFLWNITGYFLFFRNTKILNISNAWELIAIANESLHVNYFKSLIKNLKHKPFLAIFEVLTQPLRRNIDITLIILQPLVCLKIYWFVCLRYYYPLVRK